MNSEDQTERCIVCDSDETVWVDARLRCTDCGRRMERSPTGGVVRSRRLWWVHRLTIALLIPILMANIVWSHVSGNQLSLSLSVLLLLTILYVDGKKIAEALRILYGGDPGAV